MSPGQAGAAVGVISLRGPRPRAHPGHLVTYPQSTDGKTEAGAGRAAVLREGGGGPSAGGMGAGPQMCSHRAGTTRGSSAGNARRQAQRRPPPARAAQHQADPVPADDQAGLGPPGRPGQLGSGRAPPAGICMTKRGPGGSGRPPTSPRPQLPAKPPPRARRPPARSWGPPSRGGAAREPGAQLCLLGGRCAGRDKGRSARPRRWRGGGEARRPQPPRPSGRASPPTPRASTAVYTRAPPPPPPRVHVHAGRDVGGRVPVGPCCSPEAGNQLSSPLHPGLQGPGPSPGVSLPPPSAGGPSPSSQPHCGLVSPSPLPGPPSWAPTCGPSSSQEAPVDPRQPHLCPAPHLPWLT